MFQLLPCSRCQRTFSVRSEVSNEALLKCPNCGNQFRLGELLDAFYAPWQILENPGVASQAVADNSAVQPPTATASMASVSTVPATAAPALNADSSALAASASTAEHAGDGISLDGPDLELAEDVQESGQGLSLDGATKSKPQADWSNFKPITHEEFQRMKRADRSPIWSTLQVVLGGAAAIPVSLLLIWYVLDKDVAGAGPAVAQYVPWIVPEKFRGSRAPESNFEPTSAPQRVPRRGESGFRNFDDVMPAPEVSESSDVDRADETNGDDRTVVGNLTEQAPAAVQGAEPGAEAGAEVDAPERETSSPDRASTQYESAADGPTANVFALLKRTKEKVDNWKDAAAAKDTVKRDAALSLFEGLSELGVQLSTIPDSPGAPALARDKAQEICRAIKRQSDLTEVLHNAARAQLNGNLPRPKEGWALVCTVGEMLDQGDSWRIMVADSDLLPLDVPKIEIPKSIAPQLTSGQRLLLLGKVTSVEASAPATDAQPTPPNSDDEGSTKNQSSPAPALASFRASFSYGL